MCAERHNSDYADMQPGRDAEPRRARPPDVLGGRALHWDASTGAAVLYVRRLWDPDEGLARLRAEVEGSYLPRDDPLVTPADRKGERRPVPRDQAYFAARYRRANDDSERTEWWASYRYNPDQTQQPAPGPPPAIIRELSARVAELTGQVCNHCVVNRYLDGRDTIGAHADKARDLAEGSYVVSVSFGAPRLMTFESMAKVGGEEGQEVGRRKVKAAHRAMKALLARDKEWCEVQARKAAATPRSLEMEEAIAADKASLARLRAAHPEVEAAVNAAAVARRALRTGRPAASFTALLEPGSGLFFNMAFNAKWTHAILEPGASLEDDKTEASETLDEGCPQDGRSENRPSGGAVGERIGVTLRRAHTVFDPAQQAAAEGLPRARRRAIWRPVSEMADTSDAEKEWRCG